jgi:hypothetical protein
LKRRAELNRLGILRPNDRLDSTGLLASILVLFVKDTDLAIRRIASIIGVGTTSTQLGRVVADACDTSALLRITGIADVHNTTRRGIHDHLCVE